MCGIAGYIANRRLNGRAMVNALAHRGPDHAGEFEDVVAGKTVYLGHTRLSILDLSEAGRQPMTNALHGVTISYNGEIYNFQELKAQYLKGHSFASSTDTEVILKLYLEMGLAFVKMLNGDFAIAIYDARSGQVHLIRDRMGVKPLYYYEDSHEDRTAFAFGSEIKAIKALDVPLSLSNENLHKYFVFKYVPGQDTLYTEVKRVEPGHIISVDVQTGKKQIHRYWDLNAVEPAQVPYPDLKVQLRSLLEDAVRTRLIADVPVGTFLSGGLDSSIIASFLKDEPCITHYCARKTKQDLQKEGTTSDYYHASNLAKTWGIRLETIDLDSKGMTSEIINRTVFFGDDLIADGSQIPSYLIARAASDSCKVMLSGMGADELFLGYAGHMLTLMGLFADRLPAGLSKGIANQFSRLSQGKGSFKAYRRWLHKFGKYYNQPNLRTAAYSIVGDLHNSMKVCRLGADPIVEYVTAICSQADDPFENLAQFERKNFLVKNLHYFDRMCMANGIEGRVPFLDHRVVEFAAGIRRSYKLSNWGTSKKILKDAMAKDLPSPILRRRKAGFGMPLRSIFSDEVKVDELIDFDFLYGFDFINVDHIRSLITSHISGHEDNSAIIYSLISFQAWYRQQMTDTRLADSYLGEALCIN